MDNTIQHWESRIGRRLKLRDLHVLFAVVQWGSMAKAAKHLAMSQPAVSKVIADLEDVLRVRLLDRSSRGIEPTIFAHALLKRGHVVFDELRQGIREIEFLADPTAGEVRIASQELFAAGLLPAVINQLSRRYPKVVVRVVQASTATLEFRELRERKVDLVLGRIPGAFREEDLDIEILFDDMEVVVVGARSRWARRRKVALAELVNEPWVLPPNQVVNALIAEAFKAQGLEVPQERVSAGSILLRNQLLASGRFLSVLPNIVLRHNAKQWSLKALPVDLGVKPRSIAIVTLKNRTVSPVVHLFVEQVRAVAKSMFVPAGEAIETQATFAEKRKAFIADALAAEKEVEKTGLVYRAADVHRYFRARAAGKKAPRPRLVKR
jgi:DNA-binding transcriptional LysR family regulator